MKLETSDRSRFQRGIASQIGTLLDSLLEADGTLDSKIEGTKQRVGSNQQQEALELEAYTRGQIQATVQCT